MAETPAKRKTNPLRGKGGLITVGVAALLGVAFYFAPKARDPESPPPVSDVLRAAAGDVTRVELKRASGGFALVRQGGRWAFEAPGRYPAHTENVDRWLKEVLEEGEVDQTVEGPAGSPASYGLDRPAVELVLGLKSGRTRTLQVGNPFKTSKQDTTASIYYAREAGEGRLFMLPATRVDDLKNKKIEDLRDKRLMEIADEMDVRAVVLKRPAETVRIERQADDKWKLTQPFPAPADGMDAGSLVTELKSAEAASFAEGTDLAKFGLDAPRLTIQVTDKAGQHEATFGKEQGGNVYARRGDTGAILLIPKSSFTRLDKGTAALRGRDLVTLERDRITYVEVKSPKGLVRLQKGTGAGGEEWQLVDAAGKTVKAKEDEVQQLLDAVTAPAARHVDEAPADLAKYGLDAPPITVQMNAGAGTSQVLKIGKKSSEGYFAQGTENAVFEVPTATFEDLSLKPEALRDTAAKK